MIPEIRHRFNAQFRPEAYAAFVDALNTEQYYPADFRVCETPLFMSAAFTAELLAASQAIIDAIHSPEYARRTADAIPPGYAVPGQDADTTFLQLDFAICADGQGGFTPRLIELQGFPSLYCFQAFLDQKTREYFEIPAGFTQYFGGLDHGSYLDLLRRVIIADADPERAILMEIAPHEQKTRIDFACTEQMLGIPSVDVTAIARRGARLYYKRAADGREVPIERIYSRLIQDDAKFQAFRAEGGAEWLYQPLDVTWVGHPNWYYRISKYALPILADLPGSRQYTPPAYYVNALADYPPDLENYVLKPLFLYSGAGIQLDVTRDLLDGLPDKRGYLIQRKVQYAPVIETPTPDGHSMAEIRMLFVRGASGQIEPVGNLVRFSKGRMMGVRYNADKTWVGSSLAYHLAP